MAETALTEANARILRRVRELRPKKREVARHLGHKVGVLARLSAEDVPIPSTWVLDADSYTQFITAQA